MVHGVSSRSSHSGRRRTKPSRRSVDPPLLDRSWSSFQQPRSEKSTFRNTSLPRRCGVGRAPSVPPLVDRKSNNTSGRSSAHWPPESGSPSIHRPHSLPRAPALPASYRHPATNVQTGPLADHIVGLRNLSEPWPKSTPRPTGPHDPGAQFRPPPPPALPALHTDAPPRRSARHPPCNHGARVGP